MTLELTRVIRVLLADDHGVIRDGLGGLIEGLDDVELVGTAADGAEAVERARELRAGRDPDGPRHAASWTASRRRGGSSPSSPGAPCSS